MQVAFYLDLPDQADNDCLKLAINSVREVMPGVEVIHLTTSNGLPSPHADKVITVEHEGTFCERRALAQGLLTGDTLILDSDVIVNTDLSDVFNDEFDIAIATDMKPGHSEIKYNAGVIFSRNPKFWEDVRLATSGMDFGNGGDWFPIEKAYTTLIDSGKYKVKVLPGELYNYVPSSATDDLSNKKAVHYRGRRKQWLLGGAPVEFLPGLNTDESVMLDQIKQNLQRDLPIFVQMEPNGGEALIIGSGPSINDIGVIANLRMRYQRGGHIFALNGTHNWLYEHNLTPDFHVMLDARPENVEFVRHPMKKTTYLIAAQCHPSVFDALADQHVIQWLGWLPGVEEAVKDINKPLTAIGGGGTVGLRTLSLCYLWGYRKMHLYGFDSCHRNDSGHAFDQPMNKGQALIDIVCAGKTFTCSRSMAKQAMDFQPLSKKLTEMGCTIHVHGDGLIPWIVQQQEKENARH